LLGGGTPLGPRQLHCGNPPTRLGPGRRATATPQGSGAPLMTAARATVEGRRAPHAYRGTLIVSEAVWVELGAASCVHRSIVNT
jgi:hypothetical protein